MPTNIYVGNLAYSTNSDGLRDLFAAHGEDCHGPRGIKPGPGPDLL